jgi:predicted exporter
MASGRMAVMGLRIFWIAKSEAALFTSFVVMVTPWLTAKATTSPTTVLHCLAHLSRSWSSPSTDSLTMRPMMAKNATMTPNVVRIASQDGNLKPQNRSTLARTNELKQFCVFDSDANSQPVSLMQPLQSLKRASTHKTHPLMRPRAVLPFHTRCLGLCRSSDGL